MDVEEALLVVGACGKYQVFVFLCLALTHLCLAGQMIQMTFVGAVPTINASSRGIPRPQHMETIISEWNLYDKLWTASLIQSIFMFGVLVGNLIVGQMSDKFGRKPVFYKVLFLLIFTSFLTSFSNNYQTMAAIRFFVGFFQGGTVLVSFVLAQELLGSSVWTITGNIMPGLFAIGIVVLSGLASVFTNWRDLCIVTSVPWIILMFGYFFVPESPRWLYSQGRITEAQTVLRYLAKKNGVPEKECLTIVLAPKASEEKKKSKTYSVRDLFSSAVMRSRTMAMCYIWFVCSFMYYGLTMGVGDITSSIYTSVALSGICEIPGVILVTLFIDRVWAGRRKTLVGMLLFGGLCCVIIMFVHVDENNSSKTKMGLALTGKITISAAFSICYIYGTELFPTVIRNVGMGTTSMCARIGGILCPFAINLSIYGAAIPYVLFGIVAVIAGFVALVLPETLHQPIPDSLEDVTGSQTRSSRQRDDDHVGLLEEEAIV